MTAKQHKSTTTEERYFHIKPADDMPQQQGGTVYWRQQPDGTWLGAASHKSANDTFCRKTGRTVAKRHYAAGKRSAPILFTPEPSYEDAYALFNNTRNQ